jgi:hypothetical protein
MHELPVYIVLTAYWYRKTIKMEQLQLDKKSTIPTGIPVLSLCGELEMAQQLWSIMG